MKEKKYDVIIIGAGPAGLRAAEILKDSDLKVLILEKKSVVGPKVCAGGLTKKNFENLCVPEYLIEHEFREIVMKTRLQETVLRNENAIISTIDRKEFGQWQLSKLENSSVDIRTEALVTKIGSDYVTISSRERIRYKYLIGSDGSNSIVRRSLGLKSENVCTAIQYIIPTDNYNQLEFYYDSNLFRDGYAWIFPHKSYVSIGCIGNANRTSIKEMKANFHSWLDKHNIDYSSGKFEGFIINYDYQGYKFGNIYLVGDAAGLASGFNGEGIYQALVSGEEVAKSIFNSKYNCREIKKLLKMSEKHNRIISVLTKAGVLRQFIYELIALCFKSKYVVRKVVNKF